MLKSLWIPRIPLCRQTEVGKISVPVLSLQLDKCSQHLFQSLIEMLAQSIHLWAVRTAWFRSDKNCGPNIKELCRELYSHKDSQQSILVLVQLDGG